MVCKEVLVHLRWAPFPLITTYFLCVFHVSFAFRRCEPFLYSPSLLFYVESPWTLDTYPLPPFQVPSIGTAFLWRRIIELLLTLLQRPFVAPDTTLLRILAHVLGAAVQSIWCLFCEGNRYSTWSCLELCIIYLELLRRIYVWTRGTEEDGKRPMWWFEWEWFLQAHIFECLSPVGGLFKS